MLLIPKNAIIRKTLLLSIIEKQDIFLNYLKNKSLFSKIQIRICKF